MMQTFLLILAALFILGFLFVLGKYFSLWLQGFVCRVKISLPSLIFMSLRKVDPRAIMSAKIMAVQAGLVETATNALEVHYLAGGNIQRVTKALIVAHRARIELNWEIAAAIDLAGRDILEAVQLSVNPKVIDCPDPGLSLAETLNGVAKDGIQLKVRVRVTVRTNLSQLIGGATESTVIARIGEGIVSAIGTCESYKTALSNPMLIAKQVLNKGLDSQTSYSIVSIDVADIDVGDNIGARLQSDQAEADIRIARAKAEERRARAIAVEQEMVALTQENRAKVVLAEAEIPAAMANAFRNGNLGHGKRRMTLAMDRYARYPGFETPEQVPVRGPT